MSSGPPEGRRRTRRLAETRALVRLAAPIVVSQIGFVLMGFVDTVMSGRAGAVEQAVVGLGVGVWIPVGITLMGVIQALSPVVAHDFGAKDYPAVVRDTQQAVWLSAFLGLVPMLLLPFAGSLLSAAGIDPALAAKTQLFLVGVAIGMPAMLVYRALGFYSSSVNHSAPMLWITLLGVCSNAFFNDILIHGKFGLPALGGAGCGWSSGIGMWLMAVIMAVYTARSPRYRQVRLYGAWMRPSWERMRHLLRLGLPIAGAQFAEVSAFAGVALLVGALGADAVAAHQIGLNFSAMVFMLPMGLSVAMTVRIGQSLGAGDPQAARFVATTGMMLAWIVAASLMPVVILLRHDIVSMYSTDPQVQSIATTLLLLSAGWQVFDATQVCAIGALRGYKVTLLPMWLMVGSFWVIGIPAGGWLARNGLPAIGVDPLGVVGYWFGLVGGLFLVSASLLWLLRKVASARAREAGGAGSGRDGSGSAAGAASTGLAGPAA